MAIVEIDHRDERGHGCVILSTFLNEQIIPPAISLEYPFARNVNNRDEETTETISRRLRYTEEQSRSKMNGKRQKARARGRRNGAPGTRCHPIIAFALPFHAAKWQKRVPRFFLWAFDNPRRYLVSASCAVRSCARRAVDTRGCYLSAESQLPLLCHQTFVYRISSAHERRENFCDMYTYVDNHGTIERFCCPPRFRLGPLSICPDILYNVLCIIIFMHMIFFSKIFWKNAASMFKANRPFWSF